MIHCRLGVSDEKCATKVKVWSACEKVRYASGGGVKRGPRWGRRDACRGSGTRVRARPVLARERPPTCCRCVCRWRPSSPPIPRGRMKTTLRWRLWPCRRTSASGRLRSGWGPSRCRAVARGSAGHSDKSNVKEGGREWVHRHTHTLAYAIKVSTKVHEGHCGGHKKNSKRWSYALTFLDDSSHIHKHVRTYLCMTKQNENQYVWSYNPKP